MITEVDVSGFTAMCGDLAKMSGKDFEPVVLLSVGQLLSACIRRTPTRKEGQIIKRVAARSRYMEFSDGTKIAQWKKADNALMFLEPSNFDPKRNAKTSAPRLEHGMSWHVMNDPERHWSDPRWSRFAAAYALAQEEMSPAAVRRKIKAAMEARGLAKKSWWQIGEMLGSDPRIAPAFVRNAKSPDGQPHLEGTARKVLESAALFIEIANANPLVVGKLNGEAILSGALRDRQKAFDIDCEKAVFDDIERRAKRYPGIFTAAA